MNDDALWNWGRWARDRYHKQHCASLENRYKSPQAWGDWESATPEQITPPVGVLDAGKVQDIISNFPEDVRFGYAWALTFTYCYPKYDRWKAARFLGVWRPERLKRLAHRASIVVLRGLSTVEDMRYKDSQRTSVISVAHRENTARRQGRVFLKAA